MSGRLRDALVAFAREGEHVDAQLLLHFGRDLMHVVADQAHRAGREHRDGLGVEQVVGLLDRLPQPLLAAEDDVLFLMSVEKQ
jgi:hypothetical protein